jgi:HK97 family phage portal protein
MNAFQKAVTWMLVKATGFPPWTGGFSTSNYAGQLGNYNATSPSKALGLATAYGCVLKRTGSVGSLPFHVYKKTKGGRVKADQEAIYAILHDSPNSSMTSMDWRAAMMLSFDLYGNAFSEIGRMGKRVASLNPLLPERMSIVRKDGALRYEYTYDTGKMEVFPQEKILHIRNFAPDGINGVTPIQRKAFELGIITQDHIAAFLKNGARPSVAFVSDATAPKPEIMDKMREDAQKLYGGPDNAGRMMFLWGGMKPETLTLSPADMELINQMKMSDVAICVVYGVPPFILGIGDANPTYASVEQFNIQYAQHTISPITVNFQQAINKALLWGTDLYCEFDLSALMRGDSASQAAFISQMVQNGVMTRNEARRLFNLSDMEGGDELTVQSNMLDLSQLQNIIAKPAGGINA